MSICVSDGTQTAFGVVSLSLLYFLGCGEAHVDAPNIENGPQTRTFTEKSAAADKPLCVVPNVPEISLPIDQLAVDRLSRRLWPDEESAFGHVVHALRSFESNCAPAEGGTPINQLRLFLLDSERFHERYPDGTLLVTTQHGLRFLTARGRATQAHKDQCLSVLAELGVPLSFQLSTPRGPMALRHVLNDAIANFVLAGELEWTALALALYLPPQRSWNNKFGSEFTFDDVVLELLKSQYEFASCTGTHGLYTLAILLRVNRRVPILNPQRADQLHCYLQMVTDAVQKSQLDSGAFHPMWYAAMVTSTEYLKFLGEIAPQEHETEMLTAVRQWRSELDTGEPITEQLVLSTAHHLEWQFVLPKAMQCPNDAVSQASQFLIDSLTDASNEELRQGFCAYSHAVRVLRLLDAQGRGHRVGDRPGTQQL